MLVQIGRKRLNLALVASALAVLILPSAFAQERDEAPNPAPRAIDFESHRDAQGTLDYSDVLNRYFSRGVEPRNNAATQILSQVDPLDYDTEFIDKAWRLLGVKMPDRKGSWIAWRDELDRLKIDEGRRDAMAPVFAEGVVRPWAREDYPELAAWLNRLAPPLEAIGTALQAPQCWMPLVGNPDLTVNAHRLPHLPLSRDLAKCLRFRVGLSINEGKYEEAIQDINTMRRLGFFLRKEPIELSQLVGLSIYRMSHGCISLLCEPGLLTKEQAILLLKCVEATKSQGLQMQIAYDTGERAMALEGFDHLLKTDVWEPLYFHEEFMSEEQAKKLLPKFHLAFNHPGFDNNVARETINKNYDDHWRIASIGSNREFQTMAKLYDVAFEVANKLRPEMLELGRSTL